MKHEATDGEKAVARKAGSEEGKKSSKRKRKHSSSKRKHRRKRRYSSDGSVEAHLAHSTNSSEENDSSSRSSSSESVSISSDGKAPEKESRKRHACYSTSESDSESDAHEKDRTHHRRKRRDRDLEDYKLERERRRSRKDKKQKHREKRRRDEDEKKKRRKQKKLEKEKLKSEKDHKGPVTNSWGKYGIIKEIDMWTKRPEFSAWLAEVKKVNLETMPTWEEKQMFKEYMEDFNTATLPKKYYDLDAFHRRKLIKQLEKGIKKPEVERTEFNDEEQRRQELKKEREKRKEAELEVLKRSMQSGMAQAMKDQAQLREEMQYQYRLGNFEAASAIQRRLDPTASSGGPLK